LIPARILFSAVLVYTLCTAAGLILLHRLKLRLARAEAWFLAFLCGSACVSTLVFLLAILKCVYPGVLLAVSAAVLIARLLLVRGDSLHKEPTAPPAGRRWQTAFWTACLSFGVYYVCNAMAPDISPDGPVYHTGLATRYFERHGFYRLPWDMYANISAGAEMLYLFAYSFGRHSAVAVVHLLYLLALPFGIKAYGRRMGQPIAGIAAAMLFFVTPVVGKSGSIAYNDVCAAAAVFGCFYVLQIWYWDRVPAALLAAGLLAGFSFAIKYTTGIAILYAGGFVVVTCLRRREKMWRPIVAVALPAALIALPWMIKNAIYVGNPVHPFLSSIFPNRYYAERLEQDYRKFYAHPNGVTYAQVPWEVTAGGKLDGVIGPVFLLAPLALFSLGSAMGRQVLAAFAVMALPYFGNLGARFLIPPLPFVALAVAAAFAPRPAVLAAIVGVHVILSWPSFMPVWAPAYQWRLEEFPWRAALRITPEDAYLAAHIRDYRAGLLLDRHVPRGQLVYAPSMEQLAYHHAELAGSNLYFHVLDTVATGYMPDRDQIVRRRYAFAPMQTRTLRLVLNGQGHFPWSVKEIRVFRDEAELPRDPAWRLSASSNPWYIGLAFDNSLVSAWTSARDAGTGQWIQVDFGQPLEVNAVTVEQLPGQERLPQMVEAMVNGRFQRVEAEEVTDRRPFGPGLRRAAADEIKASSVQWLLFYPGDFGEEDFRLRAPYWGAREMAREGDYRLWKLE
jgi:hypothetical protein